MTKYEEGFLKEFKKNVLFYTKHFSLNSWDMEFGVAYEDDQQNYRSKIKYNIENKMVLFEISKIWANSKMDKEEIKRIAFHETMELMFVYLDDMLNKYYSKEYINKERHSIIVNFEKNVFPYIK